MDYKYTVTGVDMGLQHTSKLALEVAGHCRFQYSWYNESGQMSQRYDQYFLAGGTPYTIPLTDSYSVPSVAFFMISDEGTKLATTGNYTL